jgi:hypothetical protein
MNPLGIDREMERRKLQGQALSGQPLMSGPEWARPSLAGSLMEPEAMKQRRDQTMGEVASYMMPGAGITAYHGSPHKFSKFDMSKIGTGEGAQAYGHGLYFAENPNVARNIPKRFAERF